MGEPFFSGIILMGGEGKRMGSSVPKQFHLLGSKPVYQYTIEIFRKSALFHEIIVVCHGRWLEQVREEMSSFPEIKVTEGGDTRQSSSKKGLQACHPHCQYVMIHDAVRPFVSLDILKRNREAALKYAAVDTVIATADTLILTEDGATITSIPLRSQYRRGQTPQTFAYHLICQAHEETSMTDATDDCRLVVDSGISVHLVEGSDKNMKITTEHDIALARAILLEHF